MSRRETFGNRQERTETKSAVTHSSLRSKAAGAGRNAASRRRLSKTRNLVQDIPILYAFWTAGYFVIHPFRFTEHVVQGNWTDKMRPARFVFEVLIITAALQLLLPWINAREELIAAGHSFARAQGLIGGFMEKGFYLVALLTAGILIHFLLGKNRFSYGKAIALFSYCWAAPSLAAVPFLIVAWVVPLLLVSLTGPRLSALFQLAAVVVIAAALIFYQCAPAVKVYKQDWLKTLGVFILAGFWMIGIVLIGLTIGDWLVPMIPELH